jgi:hypothetical protein
VEAGPPALQDYEKAAGAFKSKQALLGRQILPLSPNLANEHRAARAMRRFVTAELILRRTVTIQITALP